jgi:hypothetical protein
VQRRRAFEDRERDKVLEQRKFEESLRDRQMRVRLCPCAERILNFLAVFAELFNTDFKSV